MKKIPLVFILLACLSVVSISCNSDKKDDKKANKKDIELSTNKIDNTFPTITGEFIHVDTAAVLKVQNNLYGVKMDEMAKTVIDRAKKIRTTDYDVINVVIKGEINPNTESEGWEEIITIKSLEEIYKPQPKEETKVLKYSSNKNN